MNAGMSGKLQMSCPPSEVTCSHPVAAQCHISGPWKSHAVYTARVVSASNAEVVLQANFLVFFQLCSLSGER